MCRERLCDGRKRSCDGRESSCNGREGDEGALRDSGHYDSSVHPVTWEPTIHWRPQ